MKELLSTLMALTLVGCMEAPSTHFEIENILAQTTNIDSVFPANIQIQCSPQVKEEIRLNYPVDLVRDSSIDIFVTHDEYQQLTEEFAPLIQDGEMHITFRQTNEEAQANYRQRSVAAPGYHTYASMLAELQNLETSYPQQCKLYDIGDAEGGGNYDIWAFKISDNVTAEEDEPSSFLAGGIHGNERPGPEVVLYVIDHIMTNYGSDQSITDLVDTTQLWFVPMVNPWGHENNRRTNANGQDLNRDFPTTWSLAPLALSQKESQAIVYNFLDLHHFVAGVDYHTYGELTMYPYAHTSQAVADYDAVDALSDQMASSSGYQSGSINAFMGTVYGGTADYQYGKTGIFSLAVELGTSHSPPVSQMEQIRDNELPAALMVLKRVTHRTVAGHITNSQTGQPVVATVSVAGVDGSNDLRNPFQSTSQFGSYYRMLETGTSQFTFSAPGYHTQVKNDVAVNANGQTVLDIQLVPEGTGNAPVADFTYTVNGSTVCFTDASTDQDGTIVSWAWEFGDGFASSQQHPCRTYVADGVYTVSLLVYDNDNLSNSTSKEVQVGEPPLNYCESKSNTYNEEWIGQVEVGNLSHSSGQSGYSDFTDQTLNLDLGQTYALTLTPEFNGGPWTEHFRIWIDYNRDGDFDDSGEEAFAASGTAAVTGQITTPSSATDQLTRMRVSMKYNAAPGPCETFNYGEVEDYSVRFGGGGNVPPTVSITSPADGAQFNAGDDITIEASAADSDGSVTKVEFYRGSVLLGEDATSPYAYTWPNAAAGSYGLTARAHDDGGANTTSVTVNVTVLGVGCTTIYSTDFESGADGWAFSAADSTCTTGDWGVGDPDYVSNGGVVTQLEDDHTPSPGVQAFFTEPNTGGAGSNDVDGGVCTGYSPTVDAGAYGSVELSLWYYHGQRDPGDDATGDYFRIDLSTNGGSSYDTNLAAIGDVALNAQWTQVRVTVNNPGQLRIRVQAADGSGPGDLVEGGIDDVEICAPH